MVSITWVCFICGIEVVRKKWNMTAGRLGENDHYCHVLVLENARDILLEYTLLLKQSILI